MFTIIKSQEAHDLIMQLLKDKYQVERIGLANWWDDWDEDEAVLRKHWRTYFGIVMPQDFRK